MVQLMNYSLTLSSLSTSHTHTNSSTIMAYCYVLRMTLGVRQTATGIALDLKSQHSIEPSPATFPPSAPLYTGLFGHTLTDPYRGVPFDHESSARGA